MDLALWEGSTPFLYSTLQEFTRTSWRLLASGKWLENRKKERGSRSPLLNLRKRHLLTECQESKQEVCCVIYFLNWLATISYQDGAFSELVSRHHFGNNSGYTYRLFFYFILLMSQIMSKGSFTRLLPESITTFVKIVVFDRSTWMYNMTNRIASALARHAAYFHTGLVWAASLNVYTGLSHVDVQVIKNYKQLKIVSVVNGSSYIYNDCSVGESAVALF